MSEYGRNSVIGLDLIRSFHLHATSSMKTDFHCRHDKNGRLGGAYLAPEECSILQYRACMLGPSHIKLISLKEPISAQHETGMCSIVGGLYCNGQRESQVKKKYSIQDIVW